MQSISHNLEVAKPVFVWFIRNIKPEISKWIQYNGVNFDERGIFFKFKSSQNSLNFEVYAGVNIGDIGFLLTAKTNEIYQYFRALKYKTIEDV